MPLYPRIRIFFPHYDPEGKDCLSELIRTGQETSRQLSRIADALEKATPEPVPDSIEWHVGRPREDPPEATKT